MSPVEKAWRTATRPAAVVASVEARLARAGAVIELRHLQTMSAQEMDVLIRRELHDPAVVR